MLTANAAGNLGRDASIKDVNGKTVCTFSIACKAIKKDAPPTWVDCEIWGQLADSLAPYLKKGAAVSLSGRLSHRAYSTKQGEPASALKIDVQNITLQGGGAGADREEAKPRSAPAPVPADDDDQIPF